MKKREKHFELAHPFHFHHKGSFEISFPTKIVLDIMDPETEDRYTRIIFLVLGFGFYYESYAVNK